jgi:DNA-binding NtrC family response regulator
VPAKLVTRGYFPTPYGERLGTKEAWLEVKSVRFVAAPRSVSAGLEQTLQTAVDVSRPYAEQKRELMECFQCTYFRKLIALTAGNRSEAARVAGIERSYYFSKLIKQLSHAD